MVTQHVHLYPMFLGHDHVVDQDRDQSHNDESQNVEQNENSHSDDN